MNITDSLDRILAADQVLGDLFYDKLLKHHPEMQPFFEHVDIQRQALVLTVQLTLIASYYQRKNPTARRYLQMLGSTHEKRGIPREMYPEFWDVLLNTMERFHGEHWDPELANQWKEAFDAATEVMFEGYEIESD